MLRSGEINNDRTAAVDVDDAGTEETEVLVRAAATGDAAAWTALVQRFSRLVWSVARGHQLDTADAEEVYQITWLRLAEHVHRLNQPERVGAWLATTARNESLKIIRVGTRLTVTSDPAVLDRESDVDSPERIALDAEEAAAHEQRSRRVWGAFRRLPERCQQLLRLLTAVPPPSYAEIGETLGIPIGSIGPTRARCLGRLRALLAEPLLRTQPTHQ
jgi:RNA polymerase sigma factor (sigma-70 family)